MLDMISLVSDNHVDDNLMEILVYVYFGSTVDPKISIKLANVVTEA